MWKGREGSLRLTRASRLYFKYSIRYSPKCDAGKTPEKSAPGRCLSVLDPLHSADWSGFSSFINLFSNERTIEEATLKSILHNDIYAIIIIAIQKKLLNLINHFYTCLFRLNIILHI